MAEITVHAMNHGSRLNKSLHVKLESSNHESCQWEFLSKVDNPVHFGPGKYDDKSNSCVD